MAPYVKVRGVKQSKVLQASAMKKTMVRTTTTGSSRRPSSSTFRTTLPRLGSCFFQRNSSRGVFTAPQASLRSGEESTRLLSCVASRSSEDKRTKRAGLGLLRASATGSERENLESLESSGLTLSVDSIQSQPRQNNNGNGNQNLSGGEKSSREGGAEREGGLLKEAEWILTNALEDFCSDDQGFDAQHKSEGNRAESLASALDSATKRMRRAKKADAKEFYRSSPVVQEAWRTCMQVVDNMNIYHLNKVLHALVYSNTLRSLPQCYGQLLENVEDTLASGDLLMNAPPNVVTTLLGSFSRLEHAMSMELQEKFCNYLSIKVGQFETKDLVRTLSFLNSIPRFNGLKKYTLALCSGQIARNASQLTANQISECMVAFAYSSFQPVLKELQVMEEQFAESFFTMGKSPFGGGEMSAGNEVSEDAEGRRRMATNKAEKYDTRALMRLLKSYAKLRIHLPPFIVEGLKELLCSPSTEEVATELLKPKDAANMIWYFGKMNQYPGGDLLDMACNCLVRFFGTQSYKQQGSNYVHVQHMSHIAWGLAKLRHKPPAGMMQQLDVFAAKYVKRLSDAEIVQILYGHALLNEEVCKESLQSMCRHLLSRCTTSNTNTGGTSSSHTQGSSKDEELTLRNLSVILWSLTVLRVWDAGMKDELDRFWGYLGGREGDLYYLNVRGKHMLHVAATCAQHEATGENELKNIPEQFKDGSFEGIEALAMEDKPASEIQRDISQILDLMHVNYFDHRTDQEMLDEIANTGAGNKLLSADFYVKIPAERGSVTSQDNMLQQDEEEEEEIESGDEIMVEGDEFTVIAAVDPSASEVNAGHGDDSTDGSAASDRTICVEVDGPSHFFVNTLQPTGKTLFRNRLHEANGWEVVCLPHFEWQQLEEEHQQVAYLADILDLF